MYIRVSQGYLRLLHDPRETPSHQLESLKPWHLVVEDRSDRLPSPNLSPLDSVYSRTKKRSTPLSRSPALLHYCDVGGFRCVVGETYWMTTGGGCCFFNLPGSPVTVGITYRSSPSAANRLIYPNLNLSYGSFFLLPPTKKTFFGLLLSCPLIL